VPAKPAWYRNLPHILQELRTDPRPCVCPIFCIGTSGLADRDSLITHLERIAAGEDTAYEIQRRRQVASLIGTLRQQRLTQPQLLVEAATTVVNQDFENLPAGVRLEPGRITVEFAPSQQGLDTLLRQPSNDFDRFERCVPTGPDRRLVVAIMVLSHDYCASRIKLRKSQ
jgi:hypothetical protein